MAQTPGVEDLGALVLLVSVVELGSMSQAGARHGVSQPAVSARLARLEARLGFQLLERSSSGCRPTSEGSALVEWSRTILAQIDQMGHAVQALRDGSDAVSVAASLTIAEQLLPQWLAAMQLRSRTARSRPKVRVTVANSSVVVSLVRNGDVALGFVETTEPIYGLKKRVIAQDRLVLVVGAQHPWRRRRSPINAAELAATPLVVREAGSGTRVTLESALATLGRKMADPVLELASTAALRSAAAAGVAPTVMSELAVADDLNVGRLVEIPTVGIDLRRPLTAVWKGAQPRMLAELERATANVAT